MADGHPACCWTKSWGSAATRAVRLSTPVTRDLCLPCCCRSTGTAMRNSCGVYLLVWSGWDNERWGVPRYVSMSPSPPLPTVPTTPSAASGCSGTVAGCDDDAATEVKKLCAERLEWFISGFRAEKRQQQKQQQQQQQDGSSEEQTGATEDMQILQLSMLGRCLVGLEPWPSASRASARASKL